MIKTKRTKIENAGKPVPLECLVRGGHDHKDLSDNLLYGVCKYEDDTIGLTIWEEGKARTLCMNRDIAIGLIENLSHYVQR